MNKTLFGVLTIIFNAIGVPCFIQGNVKTGIIRILLSFIPCVGQVIWVINFIMGILLGIEVLKLTEEEFQAKLGTFYKGIPSGAPKAEESAE